MSCGLSWRFQVTQNDLWELQECLQTPQSQKKPISAPEGARQPVGSSFGPLRNVFTQPRPISAIRRPSLLCCTPVALHNSVVSSTLRHDQGSDGRNNFLMKTLPRVAAEMALHVLAYNLTRVMNIMGTQPLLAAMRA